MEEAKADRDKRLDFFLSACAGSGDTGLEEIELDDTSGLLRRIAEESLELCPSWGRAASVPGGEGPAGRVYTSSGLADADRLL